MGFLDQENRIKGSLFLGAIGDAWGSFYEHQESKYEKAFYLYPLDEKEEYWQFTDDTILTVATCEALIENQNLDPKLVTRYFLKYYRQQRIIGAGASTLKALEELSFGSHWSQVGRLGEYAAGNGAAMRIAPLAFLEKLDRTTIRDVSCITHRNEEAYVGALAVVLAIRSIILNKWNNMNTLLEIVANQLPDTNVRDRCLFLNNDIGMSINDAAKIGNTGYVVDTVPLAIFAVEKIKKQSVETIFKELINPGGDTDTICSITGQIVGVYLGYEDIPKELLSKLKRVRYYAEIASVINTFSKKIK